MKTGRGNSCIWVIKQHTWEPQSLHGAPLIRLEILRLALLHTLKYSERTHSHTDACTHQQRTPQRESSHGRGGATRGRNKTPTTTTTHPQLLNSVANTSGFNVQQLLAWSWDICSYNQFFLFYCYFLHTINKKLRETVDFAQSEKLMRVGFRLPAPPSFSFNFTINQIKPVKRHLCTLQDVPAF